MEKSQVFKTLKTFCSLYLFSYILLNLLPKSKFWTLLTVSYMTSASSRWGMVDLRKSHEYPKCLNFCGTLTARRECRGHKEVCPVIAWYFFAGHSKIRFKFGRNSPPASYLGGGEVCGVGFCDRHVCGLEILWMRNEIVGLYLRKNWKGFFWVFILSINLWIGK